MPQMQDEAGNIWEVDGAGNPVGLVSQGGQPPVDPGFQYEGQIAGNKAAASAYDDDLARDKLANSSADRQLDREKFEFQKAQAEQANQKAAAPMTAVQRADAIRGYQSADTLNGLIADLETKYKEGPGSTNGYIDAALDFLPTPSNERFDKAANSMRGTMGDVLGFTGGQLNSAAEAEMNIGSFIPSATDYDSTIQDTIQRLKDQRDAAKERAVAILGGVPDQYGNITQPEAAPEAKQASTQQSDQTQQHVFQGNGGVGGEQGEIATGGTRTVNNPELAGANEAILGMLRQGQSTAEIGSYLKGRGVDVAPILGQIQQSVDFYKQNPGFTGQHRIDVDDMQEKTSAYEQAIGTFADSAPGAATTSYLNSTLGGTLDEMSDNPQQTQALKEYLRNQYPKSSFAGEVGGAASAMLGGGAAIAKAAPKLGAVGSGLIADGLYGGAYGAGETNDNRLLGAGIGAGTALAGNVVGSKLAGGLGRGLRGVQDKAVNKLNDAGVPMTLGQMVGNSGKFGQMIKGIEDRVSGLPVLGDLVNSRRREGFQAFNKAAFDDALSPIGAKVDDIGEAGIGQAQQATSVAYDDALSGVQFQGDEQFISDLGGRINEAKSIPGIGNQAEYSLQQSVEPFFNPTGMASGKNFQNMKQSLAMRAGKFQKGQEAVGPDAANVLRGASDDLDGLANRQFPEVVPQLNAANEAYKRTSILEDVVGDSAKNTDGMFTPAQLGMKAVQNTKKFGGKKANARGDRPFFELQRAAQETLPSQVPDSGTAGRLLIPGAIGGAAYGGQEAGLISPEMAGIAALAAAPQTKIGQSALQKLLLKRPDAAKRLGEGLIKRRRLGGIIGAPLALTAP